LLDSGLALVRQKCGHGFSNNDQTKTIRMLLVTHLRYFGYFFNPVSFYIIQDILTDRIRAVVGEVFDKPRNEMCFYVLHADSTDDLRVQVDRSTSTTRYIFPNSSTSVPLWKGTIFTIGRFAILPMTTIMRRLS
jgi:hypothetical protein